MTFDFTTTEAFNTTVTEAVYAIYRCIWASFKNIPENEILDILKSDNHMMFFLWRRKQHELYVIGVREPNDIDFYYIT